MADYEKLSIRNWAVEDRPREKMLKQGFAALSNAELLAILIGSGNRQESAVELCRRILSDFNNDINQLARVSADKLKTYKGMGEAKSVNVLAALELGRRRQLASKSNFQRITTSTDVYEVMAINLVDLTHEEFWVLYLDRANHVIDKSRISQGGISGTIIDVRIILKQAIDKLASGLILVHNHPSGNHTPSRADIEITRKTSDAARLLDMNVLDHLIICGTQFTSFADEGLL